MLECELADLLWGGNRIQQSPHLIIPKKGVDSQIDRRPVYEPAGPPTIVDLASFSWKNRQIHNGGGKLIRRSACEILVAPYCAIPRDYLSDTPPLRAMGFLVSQHGQLGAIPRPLF